MLEKGKAGESYNIAAHNELDNNTLVRKVLKIMNKPSGLIKYVKDWPGHDFRYSLDSTKIEKKLGWKSKYDLDSGLKNTINWYLNNKTWWKSIPKKNL